jgi:pyrroline-5-carboxylate reductase
MPKKVAIIGGGRMGQAMIYGWVKAGLAFEFSLFDPVVPEEFRAFLTANNWKINPTSEGVFDIVICAVKPQLFPLIGENLKKLCGDDTLVVSIMAGINLKALQNAAGCGRVIRAMPNTPGQIGSGITAFIGNNACGDGDFALVEKLLSPLGEVIQVTAEHDIDAVTAVSGSGPAYVFLMAEAMIGAAQNEGLDHDTSVKLVVETLLGSAKLLKESGQTAQELRKAVTSPNGTTAAAIDVLTNNAALVELMRNAIRAAAHRSKELGKSN